MKSILGFAVCLMMALPTLAATFQVNSAVDSVDAVPGDGVCGAANGKCTLRAAVMEANATPAPDIVVVPARVHALTLGQLVISSPVTIRGTYMNHSIIDGGDKFRVFDIEAGKSVQISTLTLRNGYVADTCGAACWPNGEYGGCIRNAGVLALNKVVVTNCKAETGSGIANWGNLTVNNSQLTNNGGYFETGGAIYNHVGGRASLTNTEVSNNSAGRGGGVANRGYVEVTQCTFIRNMGLAKAGGLLNRGGTARIVKSTFTRHSALGDGGGALFNQTEDGRPGVMSVINSTLSNNGAQGGGAGIFNYDGDVLVQNSTIAYNQGAFTEGGGIHSNGGTVILKNSILAYNENFASDVSPDDCWGATLKLSHSLISYTAGCEILPGGTGNLLNVKPKLGPLRNNGGETPTHGLPDGSLAIGSGSPATPGSGGNSCEKTDQRGIPRPQSVNCDMGAYERR